MLYSIFCNIPFLTRLFHCLVFSEGVAVVCVTGVTARLDTDDAGDTDIGPRRSDQLRARSDCDCDSLRLQCGAARESLVRPSWAARLATRD